MGNNSAKNDDFSKNSNFNMAMHNQAMNNLQANYTNNPNFNVGGPVIHQPKVT